MCDFVQASLLKIITNFAAVDSVFRRMHAKDFAEKLKRAFPVPFEVGEHLADIKVALGAETPGVQQNIARNLLP